MWWNLDKVAWRMKCQNEMTNKIIVMKWNDLYRMGNKMILMKRNDLYEMAKTMILMTSARIKREPWKGFDWKQDYSHVLRNLYWLKFLITPSVEKRKKKKERRKKSWSRARERTWVTQSYDSNNGMSRIQDFKEPVLERVFRSLICHFKS